MDILLLILGFLTLIIGGDFLVKGAVALAVRLKVSLVIIGLTVVSFATSAPELIVSVYAALKGHPDIALGNVIGSNIANIFIADVASMGDMCIIANIWNVANNAT